MNSFHFGNRGYTQVMMQIAQGEVPSKLDDKSSSFWLQEEPKEKVYSGVIDISEDEKCTLCDSEIFEGQYIRKLCCQHIFHTDCINKWLARDFLCPTCNDFCTHGCSDPAYYESESDDEYPPYPTDDKVHVPLPELIPDHA